MLIPHFTNSPVGVRGRGRWESDVDADMDVFFTVLHCSTYCLSVEFEMGGGMGSGMDRLVSSA